MPNLFISFDDEEFYRDFDMEIICSAGLPQSGKNIWKMKFFPGQGKVREFC